MLRENSVTVSGTLHLIRVEPSAGKPKKYLPFSVRQDTPGTDGSVRKDFLLARIYDPQIQEKFKSFKEGASVRVLGDVRSSLGSGEMYINVISIETLD
ncbi:MAG: DNA-binding protein [Synergistaceae bacterium]|nr:DNA-binding protein [Synergistaceae bacterium]